MAFADNPANIADYSPVWWTPPPPLAVNAPQAPMSLRGDLLEVPILPVSVQLAVFQVPAFTPRHLLNSY
jgi:hypothetical protein